MVITTLTVRAFTYLCLITSINFCNPTDGLEYLGKTLRTEQVKYFIYFKSQVN